MRDGLISHIQKYCLEDGPGIRTTVFLKGCPLRCAWCHNPENIAPRPQVLLLEGRCVRCGVCRTVCPVAGVPNGASGWTGANARPVAAGARCRHCGACVAVCPTGARVRVGERLSVAEMMKEVLADRLFYDDSGGGVTFSGGEPLLQSAFLKEALTACRCRGVHTAVDTCGYARREQLLAVAPLVELFLFDLKFIDEQRHREFCGRSNRLILSNLRVLMRQHRGVWIRIPIIPGVNDDDAELERMIRFVNELGAARQVNLLPYHRTGAAKFARLGQTYRLPDTQPPSSERMHEIAAQFEREGIVARIGG